MAKDNETYQDLNNRNIQDLINEAFQKGFLSGIKQGRIEGMIAYQKHIIKNIENDNVKMNVQLEELKANPKTAS